MGENPHGKSIIITAADAAFFELARSCIQSVRDKPRGKDMAVGFFDLGCTDEQLAWVRAHVDVIRQPTWEFDFPGRSTAPRYLRGLLARPFLKNYFPDFDVYVWIDADAWVQDWTAVEWFIHAAHLRQGLAIVPEIDRGSRLQYGSLPAIWKQVAAWYEMAYGPEMGKKYCSFPMLNAGVFALHRLAPHWKLWDATIGHALQRTCTNITDQIALNLAVYDQGGMKLTEFLPAWCNWTCHFGLPRWDVAKNCLVEPYVPHTPIGILHLTVTKHEQYRVSTTEGKGIDVRLRYPAGPVTEKQA